jgi:3-hydroxy-9,10-secoandrosta-1,3,5(10)-triene-9,17-dione monooxygenase reductase component
MIQKEDFKKCMGRFASGVSVITYNEGEKYGGITVSSFTSLSIDPPMILFNINKSSSSHDKIKGSRKIIVNVLSSEQEEISNNFASSKLDKHEYILKLNPRIINELPILQNNLFYLVCSIDKVYDGGDHSIFTGSVLEGSVDETKSALLYYNKGYHKI